MDRRACLLMQARASDRTGSKHTRIPLPHQVVVHQWNAAGEFLTEILDEDKVRSVVDGAGRLAGRQAAARLLMGWVYGHDR